MENGLKIWRNPEKPGTGGGNPGTGGEDRIEKLPTVKYKHPKLGDVYIPRMAKYSKGGVKQDKYQKGFKVVEITDEKGNIFLAVTD